MTSGGIHASYVINEVASVQELNLLALAFVGTTSDEHTLALLHIDHKQRPQLVSRTLNLQSQELSPTFSPILRNTVLPSRSFPTFDSPPFLIPVPPISLSDELEPEDEPLGGVLVIGGRKIHYFEESSISRQQVKRGKQSRLDARKASASASENDKAKEKEKAREGRKVKPKASVRWPWSDITA